MKVHGNLYVKNNFGVALSEGECFACTMEFGSISYACVTSYGASRRREVEERTGGEQMLLIFKNTRRNYLHAARYSRLALARSGNPTSASTSVVSVRLSPLIKSILLRD